MICNDLATLRITGKWPISLHHVAGLYTSYTPALSLFLYFLLHLVLETHNVLFIRQIRSFNQLKSDHTHLLLGQGGGGGAGTPT